MLSRCLIRPSRLSVAWLALCLACTNHPEITREQIANDLIGRGVGEGLSAWTFQRDEPRTITVIEVKESGDKATAVVEVKTESKPLAMPSFPAFPPPPVAATPSPLPLSAPLPPPSIPGL